MLLMICAPNNNLIKDFKHFNKITEIINILNLDWIPAGLSASSKSIKELSNLIMLLL